jgi:hypothetical protein
LASICTCRIEYVVKVMKEMEESWKTRRTVVVGNDGFDICNRLWSFSKDEAGEFMKAKYGENEAKEFMELGCKLFEFE